ncbi:MAG: NAD-dependent epimerase/dehydratase family protein [Planctomycetota bacterium]
MATAFVTGATGFVGSVLCRVLAERGTTLRCLVRPGSAAENLAGVPYDRVDGDLGTEGPLGEAMAGADEVWHLAALVSFRRRDAEAMRRINVDGTALVARLARERGVGRMLYMSSVAAVGHAPDRRPIGEDAPYNFGRHRIPYCDTKRGGELAVRAEVERGLDAVVVNPSSMYGPGDRRKAEGSLLQAVAYDRVPFCPSGGLNAADVRDVVSGTVAAMERGRTGERYILGGENLTGRQLFTKIAAVLGKRPPRLTLPRWAMRLYAAVLSAVDAVRPLEPPLTGALARMAPLYMWYSCRKAEDELGYAAYPIELALKQCFDWMFDLDLLDPARVRGLGRV